MKRLYPSCSYQVESITKMLKQSWCNIDDTLQRADQLQLNPKTLRRSRPTRIRYGGNDLIKTQMLHPTAFSCDHVTEKLTELDRREGSCERRGAVELEAGYRESEGRTERIFLWQQ
jgi:hypothetical protein